MPHEPALVAALARVSAHCAAWGQRPRDDVTATQMWEKKQKAPSHGHSFNRRLPSARGEQPHHSETPTQSPPRPRRAPPRGSSTPGSWAARAPACVLRLGCCQLVIFFRVPFFPPPYGAFAFYGDFHCEYGIPGESGLKASLDRVTSNGIFCPLSLN